MCRPLAMAEALLPRREQVPGERYRHGERIRVYVVNVARGLKGPEIVCPAPIRSWFAACSSVRFRELFKLQGRLWPLLVRPAPAPRSRYELIPKASIRRVLIGPGGARVRAVMENGPWKRRYRRLVCRSGEVRRCGAVSGGRRNAGVQVISEKNQTAIAFIHDDQLSLGHRQGRPERTFGRQTDRIKDRHRIRRGTRQEDGRSAGFDQRGNRRITNTFANGKPVGIQSTG